jgi:ribonuclease D
MVFDLGGYDGDRGKIAAELTALGFFDALRDTVSSKKQRTIGHNLLFDLTWLLHKFGIAPWCVGDTMLLSQIYWAGISTYKHGLKAVAARLDIEVDKSEQKSNWGFPLTSNQLLYAGVDVHGLFPVYLDLAAK